ncbi:hypothetical protein PSPO01_15785 [Paraphaeosphaeria sporulosa]
MPRLVLQIGPVSSLLIRESKWRSWPDCSRANRPRPSTEMHRRWLVGSATPHAAPSVHRVPRCQAQSVIVHLRCLRVRSRIVVDGQPEQESAEHSTTFSISTANHARAPGPQSRLALWCSTRQQQRVDPPHRLGEDLALWRTSMPSNHRADFLVYESAKPASEAPRDDLMRPRLPDTLAGAGP